MVRSSMKIAFCGLLAVVGVVGCGHSTLQGTKGSNPSASGITAYAPTDNVPLNWPVPNFRAVDENGKPFDSSMLKGHVWIANEFYSTCTTVCPPITNNMAHLQQQLKKNGADVQFVSFSVDPQYEAPSTLKKFGEVHGADFSNWHFLTGYAFQWIQKFSLDAFHEPITQTDSKYFSHTVNWYLVDKSGKIVRFFDGLHPPYDTIVQAVKSLQ